VTLGDDNALGLVHLLLNEVIGPDAQKSIYHTDILSVSPFAYLDNGKEAIHY
jgi:hypothetical protein